MAEITAPLKLGIIGMSEGNGHPYSWAAICNGYNPEAMAECPFPVIPQYLAEQKWPDAAIANVEVSHIWTQAEAASKHIAAAARIPTISKSIEEMTTQVDAVLLARDDAENHLKMALPILKAGLPIFIDKPLALSVADAKAMYAAQQYDGQVFSCSALRYAQELKPTDEDLLKTGSIRFVEARTPKSWEKYAVHLIDPVVTFSPERGKLKSMSVSRKQSTVRAEINWQNLTAFVHTYGNYNSPLEIKWYGDTGFVTKTFKNTFAAFKQSISEFIRGIREKKEPIACSQTLEIVEIIERGIHG